MGSAGMASQVVVAPTPSDVVPVVPVPSPEPAITRPALGHAAPDSVLARTGPGPGRSNRCGRRAFRRRTMVTCRGTGAGCVPILRHIPRGCSSVG